MIKSRNEALYGVYRIFGYDFLFYTVISFLFLTMVKGLGVGQIFYLGAIYAISFAIFQIPVNYIVEKIGLKKSMVLGNLCWIIYIIIYMLNSNFIFFIVAEIFSALGTSLKSLSETQLLYATLKKTNNRENFAKIEGSAVAKYYYFEALSALSVGFLFSINNYIPMILTLTMMIIAFTISLFFDEVEEDKKYIEKHTVNEYLKSFKDILKSSRLLSIFLYTFFVMGTIEVTKTLHKSIIVDLNFNPVEYSIVFCIFTIFVGIGSSIQPIYEKIFKRKTLLSICYLYFTCLFFLGLINLVISSKMLLIVSTVLIIVTHRLLEGINRMSVKKYMNNFTTSKVRGKILSLFYIFEGVGRTIIFIMSGIVIDVVGTNYTGIIIGLIFLIIMYYILRFMKSRIGLDPQEYDEKDILNMKIN
jgi:MFS family permease